MWPTCSLYSNLLDHPDRKCPLLLKQLPVTAAWHTSGEQLGGFFSIQPRASHCFFRSHWSSSSERPLPKASWEKLGTTVSLLGGDGIWGAPWLFSDHGGGILEEHCGPQPITLSLPAHDARGMALCPSQRTPCLTRTDKKMGPPDPWVDPKTTRQNNYISLFSSFVTSLGYFVIVIES